jgi:ABC-type branched-subunit amino acid transport system permease subunit
MPTVFIVVVSLAAYAVGAVATRRVLASRPTAVQPVEVFLAAGALASAALVRHPPYPVTYYANCAVAMFLLGVAIAAATVTTKKRAAGGTREFEDAGAPAQVASPWKRWLSFSRAVVDYEFRLLLVACYLLIIGPIAMASRFLRADTAGNDEASTWIPKEDTPNLDAARRPF